MSLNVCAESLHFKTKSLKLALDGGIDAKIQPFKMLFSIQSTLFVKHFKTTQWTKVLHTIDKRHVNKVDIKHYIFTWRDLHTDVRENKMVSYHTHVQTERPPVAAFVLSFLSAHHVLRFCFMCQCAAAASSLLLTTVTWIVTAMATTTAPPVISNAPAAMSCRAAPPESVNTDSPGLAQKPSVHVSPLFFHLALCAVAIVFNRPHF